MYKISGRHKTELTNLTLSKCQAKEFFKIHKEVFGIERVRDNIRLWTEDDMLTFAFRSESGASLEFLKQFKTFIKQQAKLTVVTAEKFEAVVDRLAQLEQAMAVNTGFQASEAGRKLAHTRHLRVVN